MKNIIYIGMIFFLGLTFEMENSTSFQEICLKSICYLTIYVLFEILKNNCKFSEKTNKEFFKKVDIFIFGLMIFGLGKISRRMIDNKFIEKDIILVILWVVIILIILLMILLKEDVFSFLKQENNEKLFPSRIIQGAILEEFLESDEKSLLVDGKWGIGKTYFIKKVIDENIYNRIDLDILIFNTREKLAEELMNQMKSIFKKNNIFSPNLSDLGLFLDESNISFKKCISKWLSLSNSFKDAKENLKDEIDYLMKSEKMKSTKVKKIIIFCDNLERIMGEGDNKEWKEMIAFLHDLSEMNHLKLIVAADYDKLRSLDKNSSDHSEYFEKFYDRYIKLTKVNHNEVLETYKLELNNFEKENLENVILKITDNFNRPDKIINKHNEILRINKITDDFDLKIGNPRIINKILFELKNSKIKDGIKYEIRSKLFKLIYPAEYSKIINQGFQNFIYENAFFKNFFEEEKLIEKDFRVYDRLMVSGIRGLEEKTIKSLNDSNLDKNYQGIIKNLEIYKRLKGEKNETVIKWYGNIRKYILGFGNEKNINTLIDNEFIWEMEYPTYEETETEKIKKDLLVELKGKTIMETYETYKKINNQIIKPFLSDIDFLKYFSEEISEDDRLKLDINLISIINIFKLEDKIYGNILKILDLTLEEWGPRPSMINRSIISFPKEVFEESKIVLREKNKLVNSTETEIFDEYIRIIKDEVPEMIIKEMENKITDRTKSELKNIIKLFCKRTAKLIRIISKNTIELKDVYKKDIKKLEEELKNKLEKEERYNLELKRVKLKNKLEKKQK